MYAYIKGELVDKNLNYVVIENNGIGYKIFMSQKSIEDLIEKDSIKVYTYYCVREDNISLYGFITQEELRMFELLLSVSGIGAKSALTILSEITPSGFALSVISNDVSKLTKIPGIGAKTAARIVLELKDKLKTEETLNKNEKINKEIQNTNIENEVIEALQVLGYNKNKIEQVLLKINKQNLSIEDIIKKALAILAIK